MLLVKKLFHETMKIKLPISTEYIQSCLKSTKEPRWQTLPGSRHTFPCSLARPLETSPSLE